MRFSKFLIIPFLVMTLPLAGCVTDPGKLDVSVQLKKTPDYYVRCFNTLTTIPKESVTREMLVRLVFDLRKSEKRLSQCGIDLINLYETQRKFYAKG